MTGILASLAFLAAAVIAVGAMAGTVLRYRGSIMADVSALRDLAATRDVHFRVFAFGGLPVRASGGKIRRSAQRSAVRPSTIPAGWRAAA